MIRSGQVRSGHSVSCADLNQAVIAHTCHGGGSKGGRPALAGTREYKQSNQGR